MPVAESVGEVASVVVESVMVPGIMWSKSGDQWCLFSGKWKCVAWLNRQTFGTHYGHCHRLNTRDAHNNFQDHDC